MMKNALHAILSAALGSVTFGQTATDLFISEYVEGSSLNKAIEIYNGTGATIDLSLYALRSQTIPSGPFSTREELSGFLPAGETYVLADDSAGAEVLAAADLLLPSSPLNFNGDDVVVLFREGVPIDYLGISGVFWAQDVTLRRKAVVASPSSSYNEAEWEVFPKDSFEDLGQHTFTGPLPEPSEHVTDFTARLEETRIQLSWTDATGEQEPEGYLILATTGGALPVPTDGQAVDPDAEVADGSGAWLVEPGVGSLTVAGIAGGQTYTFGIFPFTNAGTAVDYRTDGAGPVDHVAVPPFLLEQTFDGLYDWVTVNLGIASRWQLVEGSAQADARGDGSDADEASDDWLISEPIDLESAPNPVLNFDSRKAYQDPDTESGLTVYLSTDYSGAATPAAVNAADWNELSPILPGPAEDDFRNSGNLPLNEFSGTGHLAFRYRASGGEAGSAEAWAIDNVYVFGSDNVLPSLGLTLSRTSVEADTGVGAVVLEVSVPDALEHALTVALAADPADAVALPPFVEIAAGDRSTSVATGPVGTLVLDDPIQVSVTAKAGGFLADSAQLEITPAVPGFLTLSLADAAIDEDAGSEATIGTVVLSKAPLRFPMIVNLGSSDPEEATVPGSLIFTETDGLAADFVIGAVADGIFDEDKTVTITAHTADFGSDTAALTVRNIDAEPFLTLLIEPATIAEGATSTGIVFLSQVARSAVEVSLSAVDSSQAAVPATLVIPAGAQVGTFTVTGVADGIVDGDTETIIEARSAGWLTAAGSVRVRDTDVPEIPVITLQPRQAVLAEGESTTVDLVLSVPLDTALRLTLRGSADLLLPGSLTLPAGTLTTSFVVTVVAGDGYEGTETIRITAGGNGVSEGSAELQIIDGDHQLRWLQPEHNRLVPDRAAIRLAVEAADPDGRLSAVVFLVDGAGIARIPEPPYEVEYQVDGVGSLSLAAFAEQADGETSSRIERNVQVFFNPLKVADHFVTQSVTDFLGAPAVTEERVKRYAAMLEQGGEEAMIAALLGEATAQAALDAIETMILVYDRIPGRAELLEQRMTLDAGDEGSDGDASQPVTLPPMAELVALSPEAFADERQQYPGGVRGLAHVLLHARDEARHHFGADPATLTNAEFFRIVWQNRHGKTPTAQQIVQAHSRIGMFGRQRADLYQGIGEVAYGRSRFVEGLIRHERFVASTDIIYNPPNRHSSGDALGALLRLALWREGDMAGPDFERNMLVPGRERALEDRIREHLFHPNYWDRFDHHWLGAVPDPAVPGWRHSDWFGWFHYRNDEWPWVYHLHHAWLYAADDDAAGGGFWYYDQILGWAWTDREVHPWIYRAVPAGWLHYHPGSRRPRWFYSAVDARWLEF